MRGLITYQAADRADGWGVVKFRALMGLASKILGQQVAFGRPLRVHGLPTGWQPDPGFLPSGRGLGRYSPRTAAGRVVGKKNPRGKPPHFLPTDIRPDR